MSELTKEQVMSSWEAANGVIEQHSAIQDELLPNAPWPRTYFCKCGAQFTAQDMNGIVCIFTTHQIAMACAARDQKLADLVTKLKGLREEVDAGSGPNQHGFHVYSVSVVARLDALIREFAGSEEVKEK